ncbi:oxygenase MpaB family protein [uncultured Jatrophihabitans sp.]|uniref:oxygenase MpaB family protein n=1 Tax=uncultured Jatrophihabitans sp. TaxID=1610747 RepID=UPI0035CB6214
MTTTNGRSEARPAADYGFFGPESVAWRVWRYPTSLLLGFMRAVVIEELDPYLVASVADSGQVRQRTPLRYDRTLQYFATVLFGDAESVLKASDILMKIHARAVGPEPVTGNHFDANDPDSQLWIHLTAWHSILYTYEVFGPGKLSAADEARYWRECAVAAEFQTTDPASVPTSRAGIRAYFEAYRPKLVGSEVAQDMMDYLLDLTREILPPQVPSFVRWALNAVVRRGVVATMPRWMRRMAGTPQRRITDVLCTTVIRFALSRLAGRRSGEVAALDALSPRTTPVLAPVLCGVPAVNPVVYTPAEARARFDMPVTPRQQYAQILEQRACGTGAKPYAHHHHDTLLEFSESA